MNSVEQIGQSSPRLRDRKESGKVSHLFWKAAGEAAREMNVQVRVLCGIWSPPPTNMVPFGCKGRVEPDGDVTLVYEKRPRDCRNCRRVLEAHWRAEARRMHRQQ